MSPRPGTNGDESPVSSRQEALYCQTEFACNAPARRERLWLLSSQFAADGLSKVKRPFHVLADTDDIYAEWGRLVVFHQVLGKAAYDARLVAAMRVNGSRSKPIILASLTIITITLNVRAVEK